MKNIGIDIGSTYTKYCVMRDKVIEELFFEKTHIRQKEYFEEKFKELKEKYPNYQIISCGYGKENVAAQKSINELTTLAKGAGFLLPEVELVLDVGGQDTKIIRKEKDILREFFVNDKCAAGSGMFLNNTCTMLEMSFEKIKLIPYDELEVRISAVCAVFAQSEIVELIANNFSERVIVSAVICHIITQAKTLVNKMRDGEILLSGGISKINRIEEYAEKILNRKCKIISESRYLSAIGCALM